MKALLSVFAGICIVGLFFLVQPSDKAEASVLPSHESFLTTPVFQAGSDCPTGDTWFGPSPSFLVIAAIDKGNFQDQNADSLLCFRIPDGFCGNRGLGAAAPVCGGWVWKDNTN